eukprot:377423_1
MSNEELLLFNLEDSHLKQNQQKIIKCFGGFRILLQNALSNENLSIDSTQRQLLRKLLYQNNYDHNISPFINKVTTNICQIVQQSSWILQKQTSLNNDADLETNIAFIIFNYAAIDEIWVIPKRFGTCKENQIIFTSTETEYHTAYLMNCKIDPNIIGKYSCSIKTMTNLYEIYFGVIDVKNANDNGHITCIGYLELDSGYAYSFDRGGYYHNENRDPLGGAYNTNYSNTICTNKNDVMTVYVNVQSDCKAILDWGINDVIIGNQSLTIEIPKDGMFFACSTAFQESSFQAIQIMTPNTTRKYS